MEDREKHWLSLEVADLVVHMPDHDARRLRKALSLSGGGQQLLDLLGQLYKLPGEQRVAVLGRLEQMNQLRTFR